MADSRINVLTPGEGGVDVDTNSILTADNVTRQSQNATFDPTRQRAGALVKRMGLDRFNTVPLGGPVLGGIEAPFAGTAGAPLSGGGGGGNPGDSGGTNPGQPAPPAVGYGGGPGSGTIGSGGSGAAASGSAGQGAAIWNNGVTLFGGKKLIVVGMNDGSSGTGWYVTSKGFNDTPVTLVGSTGAGLGIPHVPARLDRLTANANPRYVLGQTANHDQVVGFPQSVTEGLCARANGVLFYPASMVPVQSTGFPPTGAQLPQIRRNDGASDTVVAGIPFQIFPVWPTVITPPEQYTTGHAMQIVGMGTKYGDGSKIYIGVHDMFGIGGVTITNDAYRLFRLDLTASALTLLFNSAAAGNYNSMTGTASPFLSGGGFEAWFGGVNEATGVSSTVFGMVPSPGFPGNYANWKGFEGAFAVKSDVTCMAIYKGDLYVGHNNVDATPAYAVINALPIKSASLPGNPVLTASDGGSAQANNGFVSMAIFLGKLYVSYFNSATSALIYKFDGTTWSVAFTVTVGTKAPMNLHVDSDGDVLYAFGTSSAIATPAWYTTLDGVTWTSKSSIMNVGGRFPHNVFADFNQ